MGARCLSFVNQEVASIRYIRYLRLPGFNMYISVGTSDHLPLPGRKKVGGGGSVLPWVECQDHHLTNRWDEHIQMVYLLTCF